MKRILTTLVLLIGNAVATPSLASEQPLLLVVADFDARIGLDRSPAQRSEVDVAAPEQAAERDAPRRLAAPTRAQVLARLGIPLAAPN